MDILRVFNNTVVLARSAEHDEVILVGRGLGFQARPGQPVDPKRVVRTFVPSDGRDPDHLAELLADVPPEYVALLSEAMVHAGLDQQVHDSPTLVIALADHVAFAQKRLAAGVSVEYPLLAEVQNLYPEEYAEGRRLWASLRELDMDLPEAESVAFTLHLVNAGFASGDLSQTYRMTGVIQQMLDVIATTYDIDLDQSSANVGRFITHLRYLFVRIHEHAQLAEDHAAINLAIRQAHPVALQCAERLAHIMELRLGSGLTEDEMAYLTLHVARVADDRLAADTTPARKKERPTEGNPS